MSQYYPHPTTNYRCQHTRPAREALARARRSTCWAGQRVEPSDVVAQTTLASESVHVEVAGDLDMSPAAAAKRIRVTVGQHIDQGGVLAQTRGSGSREFAIACGWAFASYDAATGIAVINTPAEPVSVHAHFKGIVTDLIPYYGAVIETPATLIRGIFGLGGEQHGVLKVIATGNDEPLTPGVVDARFGLRGNPGWL